MGFREDLEKDREQKEKQARERAYYRKVCREIPYIDDEMYKGDRPDEFYEKWYKNSLKASLSPQQQKIIDEAIEFLKGWKILPTEIDTEKVSINISKKNSNTSFYDDVEWRVTVGYHSTSGYAELFRVKHKWADGSIHEATCGLNFEESNIINSKDLGWIYSIHLGKMFQEREVRRIAQEMKASCLQKLQRKLDMYGNNYLDGSQEYVWLCYYEDSEYHRYGGLTIFRDGTVFDDKPFSAYGDDHSPLKGNSERLYEFLLNKMKMQ